MFIVLRQKRTVVKLQRKWCVFRDLLRVDCVFGHIVVVQAVRVIRLKRWFYKYIQLAKNCNVTGVVSKPTCFPAGPPPAILLYRSIGPRHSMLTSTLPSRDIYIGPSEALFADSA